MVEGYNLMVNLNLCFKVVKVTMTLTAAREFCNQSGSRLIVLDTTEKNRAISDYCYSKIGKILNK